MIARIWHGYTTKENADPYGICWKRKFLKALPPKK